MLPDGYDQRGDIKGKAPFSILIIFLKGPAVVRLSFHYNSDGAGGRNYSRKLRLESKDTVTLNWITLPAHPIIPTSIALKSSSSSGRGRS